MLTIRAIKNGRGYAARHLAYSDYISEDSRVTGQWMGKAAERLGLVGEVQNEQFENLRKGLSPDGQEQLRQRINKSDKTRTMFDCVLSAPKSLSVQAMPGGDPRLIDAHDGAVQDAFAELEALAQTRVRVDGRNEDRTTGNLVAAVYRHRVGRNLQPQLHSHVVLMNFTFDDVEGRFKALQARGIYDAASFLTEVYRASLARRVQQLGHEIERNYEAKGNDLGWELKTVAPEVREAYSESKAKQAAIEAFIEKEGRKPSKNEVSVLIRGIRAKKLIEISTAEVHKRQREKITPEQFEALQENRRVAEARGSVLETGSAAESLQYAKEHIFSRKSVARDYAVLEETLKHGMGRVSVDEARAELRVQQATGDVIVKNGNVATRETLLQETAMIDAVNRGMGRYERLGRKDFVPDAKLSDEQRLAVDFLLNSRDLAVSLEGAAGTGKTFTLQEVRRGLCESGRPSASVAPTRKAVKELEKVGFGDATTIKTLLDDTEKQAFLRGHALIVDEAGMVSNKDMLQLVQSAEKFQFRLLLVGDTKQIRSVDAGDSLRILLKESKLKKVALREIWRQREEAMDRMYRPTIEMLRDDPQHAFELLEAMKAVNPVKYNQRPARTVEAALAEKGTKNADGKPRSVLVVAPTHEEIGRYTEAIRAHLKAAGQLQGGKELTRLESLNWTDPQRAEAANYRPGMVLLFHNPVKNAAAGDRCTVVGTDRGKILTRNQDGNEIAFTKKQAKSFGVLSEQKIEMAPGDQILFQANRRLPDGRDITNGDVGVLKRIDAKNRLHLEDGRVVPPDYRQFTHGYASTAHRSQGGTVDSVIIAADKMERELFYVSCSRGRERVQVFTSDINLLRESVTWSTERPSATELARDSEPPQQAPSPRRRERSVWGKAVRWARHQARTWQESVFAVGRRRDVAVPLAQQVHAAGGDRSAVRER